MKFRKKPVVIEARQFRLGEPIPHGVCVGWKCGTSDTQPHVHTMHDNQKVYLEDGDWIIPEPDGVHFYPVKPEVFDRTYEAVE